jgi:hypothetical protein
LVARNKKIEAGLMRKIVAGHELPDLDPGNSRKPELPVGISGSPFMLAVTSFYPGLAGYIREALKLPVARF